MKFDLLAIAMTCFGCGERGHVKQTLTRNKPDEKPVFCAVDDEGGFWKLETTGLPDGWREAHARRPLCPACPDAAALPPPAAAPPNTKVQAIAHAAPPPNVRPNNIAAQPAAVQTARTLGVVRGAPAVSSSPQPAAAGGQRVSVQQTHRAVSGSVATVRTTAAPTPPASSAMQASAPSSQARLVGGSAQGATRSEVMPAGAIPALPATAAKVSAPAPIAPPQRQFSQLPESAPATHAAKTEVVSIEPLPPKPEAAEVVPSDDELIAALASENAKQEVA